MARTSRVERQAWSDIGFSWIWENPTRVYIVQVRRRKGSSTSSNLPRRPINYLSRWRDDCKVQAIDEKAFQYGWSRSFKLLPRDRGTTKDGGIILCQEAYTRKVLEGRSMKDCNLVDAPIEPRLELSKKSKATAVCQGVWRGGYMVISWIKIRNKWCSTLRVSL